jgi:hypothetical protein
LEKADKEMCIWAVNLALEVGEGERQQIEAIHHNLIWSRGESLGNWKEIERDGQGGKAQIKLVVLSGGVRLARIGLDGQGRRP